MTLRERWFGDKAFYRMVLAIALPILVQNAITNFVSLLDNVMVGRLGTDPMNGVAIANQLLFVFNLTVFGGVSGAGIFGAQYFGCRDYTGVQYTFRFKLICGGVILAAALGLLMCMDTQLISMFLHEGSQSGNITATLAYARDYLHIMFWGMLPFAVSQAYASTLRESGQAVVPMNASIIAVVVNLVFNYLLIYGKFGFPQLGVRGAALATVLARYVEAGAVVLWTHRHAEFCPYVYDLFKGFRIPLALVKKIVLRGMPLLINEMLWSTGMTILAQCYSTRGLAAVAAYNISSTVMNLFNVAVMAVGNAIGIIVGNLLGAGKMQEARRTDTRLIVFSVLSCLVVCSVMAMASPLYPADLQYQRRGAAPGPGPDPDHRRVHAPPRLPPRRVFYPALRRKDHAYLFVRQRVHLAPVHPGGPGPFPGHHFAHPPPVRHRAGGGPAEGHGRVSAGAKRLLAEQYRGGCIVAGVPFKGWAGIYKNTTGSACRWVADPAAFSLEKL